MTRCHTAVRIFATSLIAVTTLLAVSNSPRAEADGPELTLPDEPTGVVSLGQAFEAAMVRNPELSAVQLSIRIQDARVIQAAVLPNPAISTEVEDVGGTGARRGWASGQTTLGIAQLLELGGKRGKRQHAAELDRVLATFDYDARRLTVVADVAKAFAGVLAAQQRLTLARELESLAAQSVQSVSATVTAGAVSPIEEARARVAQGRAATERMLAERGLATTRTLLAATWGSTQPRFTDAVGNLDADRAPAPLDTLLARAERNPDLARWNAERAQREAVLALERSRRVPDVTVSLGGRHYADAGDEAVVFGFSVPLPLFDRNQGNVAAAELAVTRTRSEQHAVEVAVISGIRNARESMQAAYEQTVALRDRIIPDAQRTYEGARDAYLRGLFRYLEVLDAQRTLFELRGQYLDAELRYHEAAAEITRLTGEGPSGTKTPSGRSPR